MGRRVTGCLFFDVSLQLNGLTFEGHHPWRQDHYTVSACREPSTRWLNIPSWKKLHLKVVCTCKRHEGVWKNESTSKLDGRVYKFHAPVAVAPSKERPVPIEQNTMCIRESVWTLQGRVASLYPVGNLTLYPRLPNRGLITVPTAPSGIPVVILSKTKKKIF
jgi:hypothetical protein